MPFTPTVKARAVEAAAGHCCVCHRFDAGHIEVHHIQPQAKGGQDNYENAIALCFDCHTWAGHYNSNHPKGFRYSPEFLRLARDKWYARVADRMICPATEDLAVQTRYLISRDHDVTIRLLAGDLFAAPIKDLVLANNEFGKFISSALLLRPQGLRRYFGENFASIEDLLKVHPKTKCQHTDLDGYAYYRCIRECTPPQFMKWVGDDGLTAVILDKGADIAELCIVAADNGECGDGTVTEVYLTRPAWSIFLAMTNIADRPIALEQVIGQRDTLDEYRPLGGPAADFSLNMPGCDVAPNQTVLVPLALLLGPIEEVCEEQVLITRSSDRGDSIEEMNLTEFSVDHFAKFRLFGPSFWPQQVVARAQGETYRKNIHTLRLESVYTLDRVWQCGSCPHLFARFADGELRYIGELISTGQRREVDHSIELPTGAKELLIAELEDEVSRFAEVSIDGIVIGQGFEMHKGDVLHIPVSNAKILSVTGAYFPSHMQIDRIRGMETRNRLICQFLASTHFKGDAVVGMAVESFAPIPGFRNDEWQVRLP